MPPHPLPPHHSQFNLRRGFAILGPLLIGIIGLGNAWVISTFLNAHLFQREGEISRDFVQNVLVSDGSLAYLRGQRGTGIDEPFANSVAHLSNMHDVIRINVYDARRRVLWSSDRQLIGQQFPANEELDEALAGDLVVHAGRIDDEARKAEHIGLDSSVGFFVETYLPVLDPTLNEVVGAVELYKAPRALTEAIHEGRRQVALAALASACLLYFCLHGLVRRADRIIQVQRGQLMEAERMAVVGELTAAVVHNIRNPLASIRSAADVMVAFPETASAEQAEDIVRETERIAACLGELLRFSGQGEVRQEEVDLHALTEEAAAEHRPSFASKGLRLEVAETALRPMLRLDRSLLKQALASVIHNAAEAMSAGGRCTLRIEERGTGWVCLEVADTGPGMAAPLRDQITRPFFTTKPKGLGLGLPLTRRIIERFGGQLEIDSAVGQGTRVRLILPVKA